MLNGEFLIWKQYIVGLATCISKGGGGDLIKGGRVPNVVRTLAARNPELNLRYL